MTSNKEYYEKNKIKMNEQSKEAIKRFSLRKLIKKLNNNEYERIPYKTIEKYNIFYDDEQKIYKSNK